MTVINHVVNAEYHSSPITDYAITIIEKTFIDLTYYPRVAVPYGLEPDNEFTRYDLDETFLWKQIEEACWKISRE